MTSSFPNRITEEKMALEKELATYQANRATLSDHPGKFVLIHGEQVIDLFSAYDDAIRAGYQRFQLDAFLVKQIDAVETIQHITRRVLPHSEHSAL